MAIFNEWIVKRKITENVGDSRLERGAELPGHPGSKVVGYFGKTIWVDYHPRDFEQMCQLLDMRSSNHEMITQPQR